ncbi:MAG: hypothetical protein J6X55_10350 [Victivallales bacterium]|nr:hypothetical protein [Victivallales bacterium]
MSFPFSNAFLPLLLCSVVFVSCATTSTPQKPVDGKYSTSSCQALPLDYLKAVVLPETTPDAYRQYADFWQNLNWQELSRKNYNQARGVLYKLAASSEGDESQTSFADELGLRLEHASLMYDLTSKLTEKPENREKMLAVLDSARALSLFRKKFPDIVSEQIKQMEKDNDCMLQKFVKLFDNAAPVKLLGDTWHLQSAQVFKKVSGFNDAKMPSDGLFISQPLDIVNDKVELYVNFRALPPRTSVLFNGIRQEWPQETTSNTFRFRLPSYDVADGRVLITLVIPDALPNNPIPTPWISRKGK